MIIGLDVGGTHADAVLLGDDGLLREHKIPTDPADLFQTVLASLDHITSGIDPGAISRVALSTTLTTNAIVQNKIPPVGMIVSAGPGIDPEFFRTGQFYFPVSGSIDHRGREVEPVSPDEIAAAADALKREGVEYVGVVGKFSVRNPAHELKIADLLGGGFKRIFLGHRISGGLNFPRRIYTTYMNAAVYPLHKEFFEAVQKSLREKGLAVPIHILKADGGTMSLEASLDYPGQSVLSGPAASVMGGAAFAPSDGDCLVLDVGGTTTDMAVLIDGVPALNPLGISLDGYQTLIRSLETRSIGMGGDSVVKVDGEKLKIGPERLGPAMAYGGPAPTPTDALFVLNKATDGDREKAVKGITPLAAALDASLEEAAELIFDYACQYIFRKALDMVMQINSKPVYTIHEIQEGRQVVPRRILVLGGPAPWFAERLEAVSGLPATAVPKWSVANAIGAGLARTTCEVSLFADTQQQIVQAPEENYAGSATHHFTSKDAVETAFDLLRAKAKRMGAVTDAPEMEVLESQQFNMVRGFSTAGRNIRVRVQVKPGLIQGYENIIQKLASGG